jgi:hypothetical protein
MWHEYVRAEPGGFVGTWRGKQHASFADVLATLRRNSLEKTRETIFSTAGLPPVVEKLIKPLEVLLSLAA